MLFYLEMGQAQLKLYRLEQIVVFYIIQKKIIIFS